MRGMPGLPPGGYSYAGDLKRPLLGGASPAVLPVSVETIWIWTARPERWFDHWLVGRLAK
jgi:hypothetical protein